MVIDIGKDECIPAGQYVLQNKEKIERVKNSLLTNASERNILIEYDKIGGLIVKNGQKLPTQTLWNAVKQKQTDSTENLTDDEIDTILRKAENVNVSSSQYQRAKNESEIRHRKKIEASIFLENKKIIKWWEQTWVQTIFVIGALASLIGLYSLFK